MHVTWWVLTATVDHFLFANEDTNSGGLRLNDQKWLNGSQDSSPRHSTAAPEHSRERTQRMLWGTFLRGCCNFDRRSYVLPAPFLTQTWNICEPPPPPHLFWFSEDVDSLRRPCLGEAQVPHSFRDHKTLFNKIPQGQAPKKVCNKFTIKTISLVPSETIMLQTKVTWYSNKYFSCEVIRVFFFLPHTLNCILQI